jgi:hypothetical protein
VVEDGLPNVLQHLTVLLAGFMELVAITAVDVHLLTGEVYNFATIAEVEAASTTMEGWADASIVVIGKFRADSQPFTLGYNETLE